MHKAIFVLVPSFSNSAWLNDKMMQITKSFISITNNDGYPIEVVDSYYDIEKYLDKAELIIVATAGTVILEPDHIWNSIHNIPPNIGLMAHLLQKDADTTPYFHEQFFILRSSAFKNLNFNEGYAKGKYLRRSIEDMHGGWAPLYVTMEDNVVTRHDKFGTKIIEQCLENNFSVSNWNEDWRYPPNRLRTHLPARGYCYPLQNTNRFENALKSLTITEGLDNAQELFIELINDLLEFKVLNAWHFEEPPMFLNMDTVISPATGFVGEMTALNANSNTLVLYDTNSYNIEFKKHLYTNWNGKDYDTFVLDWCKDKDILIEPLMESDLMFSNSLKNDTVQNFFPVWNTWRKNANISFIHIDLIKDTDKITKFMKDDTLLCTSTILSEYPMTHLQYSNQDIKLAIQKIENTKIKYNNCHWFEDIIHC